MPSQNLQQQRRRRVCKQGTHRPQACFTRPSETHRPQHASRAYSNNNNNRACSGVENATTGLAVVWRMQHTPSSRSLKHSQSQPNRLATCSITQGQQQHQDPTTAVLLKRSMQYNTAQAQHAIQYCSSAACVSQRQVLSRDLARSHGGALLSWK